MGIYDREYYREPNSRNILGGVRGWSVNTWLIAINIAVFVLNSLYVVSIVDPLSLTHTLHQPIYEQGFFSVAQAVFGFEVWRFITFQFLHANLQHIAFNMMALFFFGPMVEQFLGTRRYLAFYLSCGIAGPMMYIVMWALHILLTGGTDPMVGASAGIFGVLIAAALIAPDTTVMLDFFIPMKLRTMVWIMLAIAAYSVIAPGQHNAGGEAAHLGGAVAGWALIKNRNWLNFADYRSPRGRMRLRP